MANPTPTTALRDVIEALDKATAALAKASPGPWRFYEEKFRPQLSDMRIIEVQQGNGRAVIPWPGFDDCDKPRSVKRANARSIVQSVNFLSDHADTIRRALAVMEAVEAAPVVEITECNQIQGHRDFDFGDMSSAVQAFEVGQRVALVRVGEA